MSAMKSLWTSGCLRSFAQASILLGTIAVVTLMPPRQGAILIVSMSGQNEGQIARWAIDHQARLLGPGPWKHSLIVVGERAALLGASVDEGALLLPGAAGCGKEGWA